MKCIYAEQVIGNTFIKMLDLKKMCELPLATLSILEKELDSALRMRNDTMVYMHHQTIYDVTEKYRELFDIDDEKIILRSEVRDNDVYLERMDDYFRAGLPKEVTETIDDVVGEILNTTTR